MKDLPKRRLDHLSKVLTAAQAVFRAEIEDLADVVRSEILPYFKKQGLDFTAGNGSWLITRIDKKNGRKAAGYETIVEDDALPQNIRDLLMLEIAHADYLGFYVRDIKRGEW